MIDPANSREREVSVRGLRRHADHGGQYLQADKERGVMPAVVCDGEVKLRRAPGGGAEERDSSRILAIFIQR